MENKKNTAASTPEMVTISRAEYDSQQAQLTELKLQNQWLLEQLGLARKRQFGASSERLQEGTSTSPAGRRSTRRPSSRTFPAGCTQTATRATTSCRRISGWLAAGLTPGENLMRRCRRCPKRNGSLTFVDAVKEMCYLTDKKVCRKEYNTEQRKMLLNYLKDLLL